MSYFPPLHIALHLVPYISPRDIAHCQKVCRSWYTTFTSQSLLSAALRTHFPRAYEVRTRAILNQSTFSTVSALYNALQSGIPQQELHFPIRKSRTDAYIWTFSSNLLVFQSSHYPKAILSLVYLDPTPGDRNIKTGRIELEGPARPVVRVKVCSDVLVVERSEDLREMGRSRFFASTECYRVNYSEDGEEVKAAMMCTIDTFEFMYIDYSYQMITDVSRHYYAAYSRSSSVAEPQLRVWDVTTGAEVKAVQSGALQGMGVMVKLMLVGDKLVTVGNGAGNNDYRRWQRFQGDLWGYLSHFRVFQLANGPEESPRDPIGGFIGRKKVECPKASNRSSTSFKVSRREEEGGEEEAALILWEDNTNNATAHHYTLATSASSPSSPVTSPLTSTYQYRVGHSSDTPRPLYAPSGAKAASPFVVKSKEALSFDMCFTGRNEEFLDTRLMLYHLRIQRFYPSADIPGVMELDWETTLKDREDKTKERKIYFTDRNVSYWGVYGMDVAGDERMSAFLELTAPGTELVMVVWDQPFKIGTGVRELTI